MRTIYHPFLLENLLQSSLSFFPLLMWIRMYLVVIFTIGSSIQYETPPLPPLAFVYGIPIVQTEHIFQISNERGIFTQHSAFSSYIILMSNDRTVIISTVSFILLQVKCLGRYLLLNKLVLKGKLSARFGIVYYQFFIIFATIRYKQFWLTY